jgi:hypothetical protein
VVHTLAGGRHVYADGALDAPRPLPGRILRSPVRA